MDYTINRTCAIRLFVVGCEIRMEGKTMKRLLMLIMSFSFLFSVRTFVYAETGGVSGGIFEVSANMTGADIYINGERYLSGVTPCDIPLSSQSYDIELKLPGYLSYKESVSLSDGETKKVVGTLRPDLNQDALLLLVNMNGNQDNDEIDYNDGIVSFREAVQIANADNENAYRIEFEDNVTHIYDGIKENITITADNLTINGDRDLDGVPDVTFSFENMDHPQGIFIRSVKNFTLNGIREIDEAVICIRADDNSTSYDRVENVRILGCIFENCELPFGGSCKAYGTGAYGYGQSGAIDFYDFYFCGNTMINSYIGFAYSGDCDYSVSDGLYFCANTLDQKSHIVVITADCNTWYVYGPDSEQGGYNAPESSNNNIIRNVLISGNSGGQILIGAGVFGNSYNLCEDVIIQNNNDANISIRPAQVGDQRNEGGILVTSSNVIRNVEIAYNTINHSARGSVVNLHILAPDECDPSTKLYADNNRIENVIIHDNICIGRSLEEINLIENGIGYTLIDGNIICQVSTSLGSDVTYESCIGNGFNGLTMYGNTYTDNYEPTGSTEEVKKADQTSDQQSIYERLQPSGPDEEVIFSDPVFEQKVREFFLRPDGSITSNECLAITSLNLSNLTIPMEQWDIYPEDQKIHSLEDLRFFPNLQSFDFALNAVEDIGPLAGLDQLTFLEAPHNRIKDIIPIESLLNLQHAVFWENQITDISPVRNLSNLKVFSVFSNQVSDLRPLADLTNLTTLEIHDNPVNDFSPLKALYPKLEEKDFSWKTD